MWLRHLYRHVLRLPHRLHVCRRRRLRRRVERVRPVFVLPYKLRRGRAETRRVEGSRSISGLCYGCDLARPLSRRPSAHAFVTRVPASGETHSRAPRGLLLLMLLRSISRIVDRGGPGTTTGWGALRATWYSATSRPASRGASRSTSAGCSPLRPRSTTRVCSMASRRRCASR